MAKLYPVDEAARDPDLFLLRARLLQAAAQRDTAFLYGILAPGVISSFGGDSGVADFKAMWRPGRADSELWKVLVTVLSLGGAFLDDSLFAAPYVFSSFPDEIGSFGYVAVLGSNVRVREKPTVDSPILATLSFDVVAEESGKMPDEKRRGGESWVEIALADGRIGYVAERFTRSPLDHRLGFVKREGRWLVKWLVAGD